MRILIVEDDVTSRLFLQKFLSMYGECDVVVDGLEALEAFIISIKDMKPYELVCLDIMLPKVDGITVLKAMRDLEKQRKISLEMQAKIIITTALDDQEYVKKASEIGYDGFISKPISIVQMAEDLKRMGFELKIE